MRSIVRRAFKTLSLVAISLACIFTATTTAMQADTFDVLVAKHDAAGNKLVVWQQEHGGIHQILASQPPVGARNWSGPVVLSKQGFDSHHPKLSINKQGNAVAVWMSNDTEYGIASLYGAMLPQGGVWTRCQKLSSMGQNVSGDYTVKITESNSIMVVWTAFSAITQTHILSSRQGFFPNNWQEPLFITEIEADRAVY